MEFWNFFEKELIKYDIKVQICKKIWIIYLPDGFQAYSVLLAKNAKESLMAFNLKINIDILYSIINFYQNQMILKLNYQSAINVSTYNHNLKKNLNILMYNTIISNEK